MLPIIAPGIVSGALFAFITSFDEVVIALFTAGSEQRSATPDVERRARNFEPDDRCGRGTAYPLLDTILATVQWLQGGPSGRNWSAWTDH